MTRLPLNPRSRIADVLSEHPNLSTRAVARLAQTSPHTVARYRAEMGEANRPRREEDGKRARGVRPDAGWVTNSFDHPAVYRCYSEPSYKTRKHGELLYVGISVRWPERIPAHNRDKSWWSEVAAITLTYYPSVGDALKAEHKAITQEHPKYNVRYRTRNKT